MANNFSNSYGIGGNEVRQEGQEAILEIPQNKTLIAQKLTPNTPVRPEIVTGLKNMDEVFEHFDPKINVAFEDDEGKITREEGVHLVHKYDQEFPQKYFCSRRCHN